MKKKQKVLIAFGIIALILILYFLGIFKDILPFSVTQPVGEYVNTIYTSNDSIKCQYDECIIQGKFNIDKTSTQSKVVIRTTGTYLEGSTTTTEKMCIGYDYNGDGLLEGKLLSGYVSRIIKPQYNRSDGLGFYYNYAVGRMEVGSPFGTRYYYTKSALCTIDSTIEPLTNCQYPEVCSQTPEYSANSKFCPTLDNGFIDCNKVYTYSSKYNTTTSSVSLKMNEQLNFIPEYKDSKERITDKLLTILNYDNSCYKKVQLYDGTACNPTESYVLCKMKTTPSYYTCSPGYSLCKNCYCHYYNGNHYVNYADNVCIYNNNCYDYPNIRIFHPAVQDSSFYSACEPNVQTLPSGLKCGAYSSTVSQDTSGRVCISKSDNTRLGNNGEVGSMGCLGSCTLGKRTGTDGSAGYQECVQGTKCPYMTDKTCHVRNINGVDYQLIFSNSEQDCILDPNTALGCNENGKTICTTSGGKEYKTCSKVSYVGESNPRLSYLWSTANCQGDFTCDYQKSGDIYPSCGCKGVSETKINPNTDIKCLTKSSYLTYSKDSSDFSCYSYKDLGNFYNIDWNKQECDLTNHIIIDRPDVGCYYNTPGYDCKETNGQFCDKISTSDTFNTCVCNIDSTYCKNTSIIKCSGTNKFQMCKPGTICPIWDTVNLVDCSSPRSCKTINGVDTCSCNNDIDCNAINVDNMRCKTGVAQPQTCKNINGCYVWQDTGSPCSDGYVCTEENYG